MPDYRDTPDLLPDWYGEPWVPVLVTAYEADGPTATARRLGSVSPSMVTAVARGYYKSPVDTIREAVRAVLMTASVECPVLGSIELNDCRRHRERPFAATNPLRIPLFQACRSCPNNPNT